MIAADPNDISDAAADVILAADLFAAGVNDLDATATATVPPDDWAGAALVAARIDDLRGGLAVTRRTLGSRAHAAMPGWQAQVGSLLVRRDAGTRRHAWAHRQLAERVVLEAMAAGQISHPLDVVDVLFRFAYVPGWRVKELAVAGINADEWCEVTKTPNVGFPNRPAAL